MATRLSMLANSMMSVAMTAPCRPSPSPIFTPPRGLVLLVALAGSCNRYFAGVKPGEMSGDVTVGLAGATRMMCPPEQMAVEDRFLKQLGGVKKFAFMAGQLALSYATSGHQPCRDQRAQRRVRVESRNDVV